MALAFGPTKMAKKIKTVAIRVMELNDHMSSKFKVVVQECKYFSLALDESVGVCDVNNLLIFIRTTDKNFTIHEELLQAVPLQGTARSSDIYSSLVSVSSAYGDFEKCFSVVTDGAPAMVGRCNNDNLGNIYYIVPCQRSFSVLIIIPVFTRIQTVTCLFYSQSNFIGSYFLYSPRRQTFSDLFYTCFYWFFFG